MYRLSNHTRHRCFISYHHDDENEVRDFIDTFDHGHNVFISRGIGAAMPGDVLGSSSFDYIAQRIRALYLNDSTVTIVMIGRCTWARQFVDWEVAASLRNTTNSRRNGLMAITLPSATSYGKLPTRVSDNVNGDAGYARWWQYPSSTDALADIIEIAHAARTGFADSINNSRPLSLVNKQCK